MDVEAWLRDLGMQDYAGTFAENGVDGTLLAELSNDDLKDLGVSRLADRKKLLKAIAALADISGLTGGTPSQFPATTGERRQLSVLFVDLVGSTQLSSRLDPEAYEQVIRGYQDVAAGVVARYGGHVAKLLGDGMLITFGYPRAQEDDAERAVRTALEIIAAVSGLRPGSDTALEVRVGIATGLSVVSDFTSGDLREEGVISGETPNLAARLQAIAEPGSVVISDVTRSLIEGLFSLEFLEPRQLKGFPDPVPAWRVIAMRHTKSRFQSLRADRTGALVGRDQELALLLNRWKRTIGGDGQVVELVGEAGIGKSRIVWALEDRVSEDGPTVLHYQCSPQHEGSALHPFIEHVTRDAGLSEGDAPAAKLDKLERLIARSSSSPEDIAPLLAMLLSIPAVPHYAPIELPPRQLRDRTLAAFAALMSGFAECGPLLVIVEDLHWIDPTSLELLDMIVDLVTSHPLLLIVTARPSFPLRWVDRQNVTILTLNRLSTAQSAEIIAAMTGGKALPEDLQAEIISKTDGVPLFLEELTKMLLEGELLHLEGSHYRLDGELPDLAIPTTLQDSLMARLDRLDAGKAVAQLGATIGRTFSSDLLERLARPAGSSLERGLQQLSDAGLLFKQGRAPNLRYTFKHALIQDAAYQSQLQSQRRELHREIAECLAEDLESGGSGEPEIVAHHFTEAKLVPQAIDYWEKAATRAIERSTYAEAVGHLKKAIALVADMPPRHAQAIEFRLQMSLGKVYRAAKGSGSVETEAAYRRAHDLSKALSDPEQRLPVLYGLYISTFNQPNLSAARALASEIAETATGMGNRPAWLVSQQCAGAVAFLQGRFSAALEHFDQALAVEDADKVQLGVFSENQYPSLSLTYLSWTLFVAGYADQARARQQEAIAESKGTSPFTHALALGNACYVLQFCQDTASIEAATQELLEIAEARGIAVWGNMGRLFAGWSKAFKGDTRVGLEEMDLALEAIVASRQEVEIPYLMSLPAEICLKIGETERGRAYLRRAFQKVAASCERWFEAELHRLQGAFALAGDDADITVAEKHFQAALDLARAQNAKMWELRAASDLAGLWHGRGEGRKARELLAPVYDWFSEGHDTPDLAQARALLREWR